MSHVELHCSSSGACSFTRNPPSMNRGTTGQVVGAVGNLPKLVFESPILSPPRWESSFRSNVCVAALDPVIPIRCRYIFGFGDGGRVGRRRRTKHTDSLHPLVRFGLTVLPPPHFVCQDPISSRKLQLMVCSSDPMPSCCRGGIETSALHQMVYNFAA
jgi:hypothetical protein